MCYSDDARPPLPPISGAAASDSELQLRASDGNRFAAYTARAEKGTGAGVVILPDVRGLHQFYKELVLRFAESGIDAIAFDYFGRTAGIGTRDDSFDGMSHVQKTTREGIAADVGACIEYLRSVEGGAVKSVFTLGFCFGGGNSWTQAALQPGLNGAIGFYGRPERVEDLLARFQCPLLLLMGGADQGIPVAEVERFAERLQQAGKEYELHIFEGATHSFFDRRQEQFAQASQEAWRYVLDFIQRHSQVTAGR